MIVEKHSESLGILFFIFCFRSGAWKFLRDSMKQRQSTENLIGFIHWEHVM